MKQYLLKNVLPFWLDNAIDEKHGGIFTCLYREGNIYGEKKACGSKGALCIFYRSYTTRWRIRLKAIFSKDRPSAADAHFA